MGKKLLGSEPWAANGSESFKLSGLPDFEPGGISYLDQIWVDVNITDIDNAGGDCEAIDIYNSICQSMTMTDGTEPWGPVNLSGELLAESRYLARRTVIPFQGNANGDRTVATGSNGTRRFAIVYDFRAYGGDDGDATPLCKTLKNGSVEINFGALPTEATSLTATLNVYAVTHGEPTVRAVPRIQTVRQPLASFTFDILQSGIFLQTFIRKNADLAAAEIAKVLSDVGGIPLTMNSDPFGCNTNEAFGSANPLVTASLVQNHFCEPVGGTQPRAMELLSFGPKENWSRRPQGTGLHFELTGTGTPSDFTVVSTYARFMDATFAGMQLVKAGAPVDIVKKIEDGAADVVKNKTKNGRPLSDSRMQGFVSVELIDPTALRAIGLK